MLTQRKDPPRSCRNLEANMKPIKKCIEVVSNLSGSATMDYKVIQFNDAASNPEIMICHTAYQNSLTDHNVLASAAYMNLIKQRTIIMSNPDLEYTKKRCKAVKFNST